MERYPRKFWQNLKKRLKKANIQLSPPWRQLPYLATDGKRYQTDHLTNQGLYQITQRMDANTGLRTAVLDYLAQSGVVLDEMSINPEESIDAAIEAYKRMGKSEKWIATRIQK